MAGEVEEPFRLDFKADSFHSGSISFGRFETEALCWERRSSFSHNRYLEEVEKCSTPGLVTEKKAYFEARLRKKGILSLGSPGSQNEAPRQTSDNDRSDSHTNVENCSLQFDESPECSQHESECNIMEQESGEFGSSNLDFLNELVSYNTNVDDKSEVKEDPDDDAIRSESSNVSNVTSHAIEETSDSIHKGPHSSSNKEKVPPQAEPMKSKLVRRVSAAHSVRYSSSKEASKGSEKKPSKTVNKVSTRTKAEKTPEASSQDKIPMHKSPKPEPGSKVKGLNGIKRGEKERNRGIEAPQSTFRKLPSRARHSENRIKPAGGLTQPRVKQDNSKLKSIKCDERAERRKEFDMKIGEKTHSKEAQMHQLKENARERREAEVKQLRKSLNFKATPLPTFYHGVLRNSDRNKVVAGKIEPQKTKSSRTGNRVSEGSKLSPKSNKGQTKLCPKTIDASGGTSCHSTLTSDSSPSSPAAETSKAHHTRVVVKNRVGCKEEREKSKVTRIAKAKGSQGTKMYKGKMMDV